MKKHRIAALLMASAIVFGTAGASVSAATADSETVLAGGWEINRGSLPVSSDSYIEEAFGKAVEADTDFKYQPIAYIGSQVVAGRNICVLCRKTDVNDENHVQIQLVYIYADLKGNAEITGRKTIIGDVLPGGFAANRDKLKLSSNKEVYDAFAKAAQGSRTKFRPIAYLGSQVVAGNNYLILCRTKSEKEKPYSFSLVTVYADLEGNAEITNIEKLSPGTYDD